MSFLKQIMESRKEAAMGIGGEQAAPFDFASNGALLDTDGGKVFGSLLGQTRAAAAQSQFFGEAPPSGTSFAKYSQQLNTADQVMQHATGMDAVMQNKMAHDEMEREIQTKYASAGYFSQVVPPLEVLQAFDELSTIKAASMTQVAVAQALNTGEIQQIDPEIVPIIARAFE